jgi:hypothetical protein
MSVDGVNGESSRSEGSEIPIAVYTLSDHFDHYVSFLDGPSRTNDRFSANSHPNIESSKEKFSFIRIG